MFKFITNRPLWVNIVAAVVSVLLLIFIFLQMLSWITKHGEHLTVPSVLGMKTDDAVKVLNKQGFEVEIQDSVFTDTAARGIVLKQLPDPDATVKVNRTVFLTVNRFIPPMIEMPKLEGQSLRFAIDILTRNHLVLGDTIFKPDFMQGSVLEQIYNGARIPEKAKLQWGSSITLVVGAGLGDEKMLVPSLVGLTFTDAKKYLFENGIGIGAVTAEGIKDSASAFVIRQNPERFDETHSPRYIQRGQVMDIWLSVDRVEIPVDSLDNKK